MIIGFVGLGKMGRNMVLNLVSKNIKVELQDQVTKANQRYHAVSVSGINGQWQKISIPLKNFTNISTRNQIMEFIILVNKEWVTSRKGAFYIDQIFFSKE